MRKILLFITAIAMISLGSFANEKNDTIQQLQASIEKLEAATNKLAGQLSSATSIIQKIERELFLTTDSLNLLKAQLANTDNSLRLITENLGLQIQESNEKTSADLTNLSDRVSKSSLFWIIGALALALLSVLLFGWLKKQLNKEKSGLSNQIKKTSDTLREEQLKLDSQLIKLLDSQIQLMNIERQKGTSKSDEVDHSLALKVADEIIRIQQNLSNMDPGTKGLKQLSASVNRIQSNFEGNGYEIVDMLNKPFDAGMKVTANFKPDETLKPEEQIITRIIKPQVNFNGIMIQSAQIEVSQGE